MELGAVYPQIELQGNPDAVRTIGQSVEHLGYNYLLAYDHVLGAVHDAREPKLTGPYTERDPFHDPFVLFAYLAGMTTTLQFATGVIILPQRQTALVARQCADLDLLSGGRFRLGVGVGWNYVEYDALGQDFTTRGAREAEQIELLRRLWTEPVVDFTGRFDRVDRAGTLPLPGRAIPIWLGGWGKAAFDRAARLGDGFIFGGKAVDAHEHWKAMRELAKAHGRDDTAIGGELLVQGKAPEQAADRLRQWRDLGGTHGSVISMSLGLDSAEAHVDFFGAVREAFR